ncbi:EAL domain-containing protein [Agrobacterium sp. NPDC090283]|uniref:sensor domain-containing protein n=1 Tax=Agrobacterium sp. NPDC090283 TaxID=3363920 RepID=UPI00383A0A8B
MTAKAGTVQRSGLDEHVPHFTPSDPSAAPGAWSFDLQSGTIWWSQEIDRFHGISSDDGHAAAVTSTHSALLSWMQAVALRSMTPNAGGQFELDVDIRAAGKATKTLRFCCILGAQGFPPQRLFGIAFEKSERAGIPLLPTTPPATKRLTEFNSSQEFAIEATEIGIWEWDATKGEVTHVENCLGLLGPGSEDMRTQRKGFSYNDWSDLLHPEDRQPHEAAFTAYLQGNSAMLDVDCRILRADGSYRWCNTRGKVIERDAQGRSTRVAFVFRDIHRWKLTELKSTENEALFRGIFENTRRLVALITPEGRNIFTNPAGYAFTGLVEDETSAVYFWEGDRWLNDGDRALVKDAVQRAAAGETVQFEISQRAGNGEIIASDLSVAPIRDSCGKVTLLLPEANDITGLKATQQALSASERIFREVFEFGPIGAAIIDIHGCCLRVNDAFANLLGYTVAELSDLRSHDVTPAGDINIDLPAMEALLKKGDGRVMLTKKYIHRDGHIIDARVAMRAISGDIEQPDETLRFLAFIQDPTELRKTQAELHTSRLRSELALESAGIGIWEWDAKTNNGFYSQRTCEILEVEPNEIISKEAWFALIHPEDLPTYTEMRTRHLEGGQSIHRAEIRIRRKDGTYRWVEDLGKVVERSEDGSPKRVVGTFLDIHHRKIMEEMLKRQSYELSTLVEHSPDGIIRYDRELRRLHANPAMRRFMGGVDPASVIGQPFVEETIIYDPPTYLATLKNIFTSGREAELEARYLSLEGEQRWLHAHFTPEIDGYGEVSTVLVLIRDTSEIVRQREKVQELAFCDPLTGLPNRARFNERFGSVLAEASSATQGFALIIVDLDNFKDVNDTLGHAAGDELLRKVTTQLSSVLHDGDMLARLGGDEFAILLENVRARDELAKVADRLLGCVRQPFHIGERDLFVSASFGIASHPDDGTTGDDLFARADAALYEAKARGRNNYQFYDPGFTKKIELRLRLGNALRTACTRNELELHYQPKIELETGRVVGAEALLRWRHPEFGLVMPSTFIPIAEENGTIIEIGDWVIRNAARTIADWNRGRKHPLKVAVNLSARQFAANDLACQIQAILSDTGCLADWVECEITESLLLEDSLHVQASLEKLHAIGISIAIDDFGTGHSALSCLNRFPIDVLKIDRSFIVRMSQHPRDRELVSAFISIASALGMTTVSEGVETREQADALIELGCRVAQGYLFGKPVPQNEFVEIMGE